MMTLMCTCEILLFTNLAITYKKIYTGHSKKNILDLINLGINLYHVKDYMLKALVDPFTQVNIVCYSNY